MERVVEWGNLMAKSRFKIIGVADFGKERFTQMVIERLKLRQSNLVVHSIQMDSDRKGRPLKTTARVEVPMAVTKDRFSDWVMESLRDLYGGPPFLVQVEEDTDPLPSQPGSLSPGP